MDQLTQVLQRMADQFGVTVEYLWPLLVTYTKWTNFGWLCIDLLVIGLTVAGYLILLPKAIRHLSQKEHGSYSDPWFDTIISIILGGIVLAAVSIPSFIALASLPQHLAGFMVPEARAVLDILGQLKGK